MTGLYVVISRHRRTARIPSLSFASLAIPAAAVLAGQGAARRGAPGQREARAKSTQPRAPPPRPEGGTREVGGGLGPGPRRGLRPRGASASGQRRLRPPPARPRRRPVPTGLSQGRCLRGAAGRAGSRLVPMPPSADAPAPERYRKRLPEATAPSRGAMAAGGP